MGLMDFIRKQTIDVIEWVEPADEALVWQFPTAGKVFHYGANLIVRETQVAVFVEGDRVADVFMPGHYKLTRSTLPLLARLKEWDSEYESPFTSELYFVNTLSRFEQDWQVARVPACSAQDRPAAHVQGLYAWGVKDAKQLISKLPDNGSTKSLSVEDFKAWLHDGVESSLSQAFLATAAESKDLLIQRAKESLAARFAQLGLELHHFEVTSITPASSNSDSAVWLDEEESDTSAVSHARAEAVAASFTVNEHRPAALAATPADTPKRAETSLAYEGESTASQPEHSAAHAKLRLLKSLLDEGLITLDDYEAHKQAVLRRVLG